MSAVKATEVDHPVDDPSLPRRRISHQKAIAVVYAVSMFINVMDTEIVNVALSSLSRDFHVTIASVQWVVTSYIMAIAVFVPASGWLGDRFGTKRMYLIAVSCFTIGSLLCALSTNLPELICTRIIQGAGGGMMMPVGMAMLYRAYPPARRIHIARLVTRVMVIAPATAPMIGGALVTYASWQWIFTINLPFGIAVVGFGWYFLTEHREPRQGTFDLAGALSGGSGLALLLYTVGSGPTVGWGSPTDITTAVASVLLLGFFVRRELRTRYPLLDLNLLSNRLFRRTCATLGFSTTAFFGSLVFTNLYLQEARGLTALNSGLSTFPEAIGIGISSQIAAKLFPKFGPRRLMCTGFISLACCAAILSQAGLTTSLWEIRIVLFFCGCSLAQIMLPSQATAFSQITPSSTGQATAIFNTLQRSLSSIGVAFLSTVLALAGGDIAHVRPSVSAFHWVFAANVGLALCGATLSFRIRTSDAAVAMGKKLPIVEPEPEILAVDPLEVLEA